MADDHLLLRKREAWHTRLDGAMRLMVCNGGYLLTKRAASSAVSYLVLSLVDVRMVFGPDKIPP